MAKHVSKVIYKPGSQSTDEFTVIVNPVEYKKYVGGETSIPLVQVVDSFEIFFSNQGSQGILGRPSKQQLENVFQTSKDVDIVQFILENGVLQSSDKLSQSGTSGATNISRTSASIDTRGGHNYK